MNELFHYITPKEPKEPHTVTVGIPRAMNYLEHGKLWENFFTKLGCGVMVSQDTNRSILNLGVEICRNETCLPVKAFAGHIASLVGKADVIFVPRYISTARNEFSCPILCGLPDMARLAFRDRAEIIEIDLDFDKGTGKTDRSLHEVSHRLRLEESTVRDAFFSTVKNRLNTAMEAGRIEPDDGRPTIALLGHPYMIYDPYLSMNLIKKLRRNGYHVITPANLEYAVKRKKAHPFTDTYFYQVGYENLGSAYTFESWPMVRGVIYLTPFGCGVDSLITEFIDRHFRSDNSRMPFMKITVDEHSGEAGFDTRLEAFLDLTGSQSMPKSTGKEHLL